MGFYLTGLYNQLIIACYIYLFCLNSMCKETIFSCVFIMNYYLAYNYAGRGILLFSTATKDFIFSFKGGGGYGNNLEHIHLRVCRECSEYRNNLL